MIPDPRSLIPDPYSAATQLRSFASKQVISDLLATFGGRVAQMLLALAGNVISARALGPSELGRFGLVMATVTICGTLADAGLTYTAVKFIAQYSVKDDARVHAVARAYLALRLCTGAGVALLGAILSAPIANLLLGQPDLTPYVQLAFAMLIALSISSYPGTVLIGLGRFGRLGIAAALNAAITLAGILLLLTVGQLNLAGLIAWNVILPIISTLPAWLLLPAGWLPSKTIDDRRWTMDEGSLSSIVHRLSSIVYRLSSGEGVVREMLGFSKWMMVSTVGSIIAAQGDVLLLGRLAGPAQVGVYSVALALALRLDTLNQSLLTIMTPRASRLEGTSEIKRYTRRAFAGSLTLACFLGLVAIVAQPLIALLYGERYTASAGLFLALAAVALFDLITSSVFLIALPLNKPRVLAASDWLRVAVLGIFGWLLIPAYSGYGAAAARFLSRVSGAGYTFYGLRQAFRSTSGEGGASLVDDGR